MAIEAIRLVNWKDDNKIIDVCDHISLRTAETFEHYEYAALLIINCKVCKKRYQYKVEI